MKRGAALLLLVLAAILALCSGVAAAQGEYGAVDTAFGTDGEVHLDLGSGFEYIAALAVQPDGKIVAAAYSDAGSYGFEQVNLLRFNPDGSSDFSFGAGGRVTTPLFGLTGEQLRADLFALALQPDGKILLAGDAYEESDHFYYSVLMRYNSDGSLDYGFAQNGVALITIDVTGGSQFGQLALAPDGKIVAAGYVNSAPYDFIVARFDPDGKLDNTFNGYGVKQVDYGYFDDTLGGVAVQPDGKIVLAASSSPVDEADYDFVVVRLLDDGTLDPAFGQRGATSVGFNALDFVGGLILLPDGKPLVWGTTALPEADDCTEACERSALALAQFNADGSPDTSFGNGGKLQSDLTGDGLLHANSMLRRDDGTLLLAGIYSSDPRFAVALLNPDGSPRPDFGADGVKIDTNEGPQTDGIAVAQQADGKILVGGWTSDPRSDAGLDILLTRLSAPPLGQPAATPTPAPPDCRDQFDNSPAAGIFYGSHLRDIACAGR